MSVLVGVDAYAALDEFLEVILADEDFFEDAFAAVVAPWDAGPPYTPAVIGSAAPRPGHPSPSGRARQLRQWSIRAAAGQAWQLRVARSPPADHQS
jgi:hypothetical protein